MTAQEVVFNFGADRAAAWEFFNQMVELNVPAGFPTLSAPRTVHIAPRADGDYAIAADCAERLGAKVVV